MVSVPVPVPRQRICFQDALVLAEPPAPITLGPGRSVRVAAAGAPVVAYDVPAMVDRIRRSRSGEEGSCGHRDVSAYHASFSEGLDLSDACRPDVTFPLYRPLGKADRKSRVYEPMP